MLPALPHQRRALVHRVQPGRDHHRANDRHWNGYDLRGSEHQQPGQHHRRTGRSHVVHRQRQHYWPDHHLSDTHDQSIHPHLGSGRNNGHHHRPQPGQATKVSFGGTAATIVSDTATWVVTKVLTGALTGPILVTTAAGTATSIKNFQGDVASFPPR